MSRSAARRIVEETVMARVPTIEELRGKAQECRANARDYREPALRQHMAEIADVYERLARNAEQHEARVAGNRPQ
jgi:hypothetical protein